MPLTQSLRTRKLAGRVSKWLGFLCNAGLLASIYFWLVNFNIKVMSDTRGIKLIGLSGLVALAAGVFLATLTSFFANSNIHGNGWALNGNGSLFVPFGIGPAFLAMAWSGLVLHARRAEGWEKWAGITLGVGILIAAMGLGFLVVFPTSLGVTLNGVFAFLPWVFAILSLVSWVFVPVAQVDGERVKRLWYVAAGVVYAVILVVSFFVAGRLIPA